MSTRWIEGVTPVSKLLEEIAFGITDVNCDTDWILCYPDKLSDIIDIFVVKYSIGNKDMFLEFYRPNTKTNFTYMECRFGTNYTLPVINGNPGTFSEDCGSVSSRFSWFKSNTTSNIKSWLPTKYWISINQDRFVLVLQGDPSANYKDGILSFGYFGKLTPYNNSKIILNNFGITVSSDIPPFDYLTEEQLNQYSDLTGTGVTDFTMLETATGFPFQRHFISFTTPDEYMNKKFEGPSNYTKGYHFSKINICNGYEGYRGYLSGITVGDLSSLTAFEEVARYDEISDNDTVYQVFLVNASYSILNNGPNILYAIAILKSDGPIVITDNITVTPAAQTVIATSLAKFKATVGDMDITNLIGSIWDINNPDYSISKGVVTTTSKDKDSVVSILWKGITGTAQLFVKPVTLTVHPSVSTVNIGTGNIVFTCLFGDKDVTDHIVWSTDNLNLVMEENKIPIADYIGEYHISATLTTDGTDIIGTSKLTVVDQIFTVTPGDSNSEIDSYTVFKAMLGTRDVTDLCIWTITNPYTVSKLGKSSIWDTSEVVSISVSLPIAHKNQLIKINVIDSRILTVIPNPKSVQIGDTVQYQAILSGTDISRDCEWSIPSPYLIDLDGTVTNLLQTGSENITATYSRTHKLAKALLNILDDRVLTILPSNFTSQVGTQVQYKSTLGGVDITKQCEWSIINSNYTIDENALTGILSISGSTEVTAYYPESDKTVTASLTISDDRDFIVSPITKSVTSDIGVPVQFNALLDNINVSSNCIWTVSSPYKIDQTGKVSNTSIVGTAIVTAVNQETKKSSNASLIITTSLNINHDYDIAFVLDWPSNCTSDLDLHATWGATNTASGQIYGGEVYYGNRQNVQSGNLGTVTLDHDNTRSSESSVLRTDPSMCETISIKGMKDVLLTINVVNYNSVSLPGSVNLRIFDNTGKLIKTYTLVLITKTTRICSFMLKTDGTYSVS